MSDEAKVRLMQVTNPDIVTRNWGIYSKGMESVMEACWGDSSLSLIYEQILKGQLTLWLVYLDTEMVGFVTTRFVNVPQGSKYCEMVHGFLQPGIPYTVLIDGLEAVVDEARKWDCDVVRFYTQRDGGFERKLKANKWERGYVEFIRKIKED